MMNKAMPFLAAAAAAVLVAPATAQQPTAEQLAYVKKMEAIQKSLHPETGDILIPAAKSVLHLGKAYYFLPEGEARRVLVDAWGNHPDSAGKVLGIVFPQGKTFLDDTWGAVITYEPMGYVSDEDATSADYDALMSDMRQGEEGVNAERTKQGYPAVHLIGWAESPRYDKGAHSVVWARNIKFEGAPENSLNYDVRLLGRHGVLSLNMVSAMSKLAETRQAAAQFAKSAEFNPGARYADYQPGVDTKAEVGIAGLVAAGAGVAVAKKLGLLALILAFGKKFLVIFLAAFAGIGAWIKRKLGREDPV